MLERHFTAERINEIVNHPTIYPLICGYHTGPLDLTTIAANPDHVCLVGAHGCVLFIKHQIGVYEFHTSVLPEGRGPWMVEGSQIAFKWMFCNSDAFELLTKCPQGNVAAKAGARAVGCVLQFSTCPIWPVGGVLVPVDVYSVVLQHWAKNAKYLVEKGELFHTMLDEEYSRIGWKHGIHAPDETHNRYVGAAVEMIRGGQVAKAINFYNRWAVMSGYERLSVVSVDPLILDIKEARIAIKKESIEVVQCQRAGLM